MKRLKKLDKNFLSDRAGNGRSKLFNVLRLNFFVSLAIFDFN